MRDVRLLYALGVALGSLVISVPADSSAAGHRPLPSFGPPRAAGPAAPAPALNLPRVPWEGGPAYYARFPKAHASGWSRRGFFPISVYLGKPQHAASLKAVGINTYMGAEHDGSTMSSITRTGMFVLAQREWSPAAVVGDRRVVGWNVHDECEMGYSGCTGGELQALVMQEAWVRELRALNDGRFLQANFGNGVLGSFWAPNTFHRFVQGLDVSSVDKYAYASAGIWSLLASPDHSPHWPRVNGVPAPVARSGAYGWLARRMRTYQDPRSIRPVWVFVETANALDNGPGSRTITPDQIEGAVWSAIINEARGIAYFQHNNNGRCGVYSIVECGRALRSKLTAIHTKIRLLAPVINTQSYRYDFANGTETMLKTHRGHAYVFAGIGVTQRPGVKTFRLPRGIRGTKVTVVGEGRTLRVVDGRFRDRFPHEYTHRVYRISLTRD